jgi:hypothetical protein
MVEISCVTLLTGSGSLKGGPGAVLVAGQLRLEPDSQQSLITARLLEKGRVNVAVSAGGAVVKDPTGVVLAKLLPGQALLFGLSAQEQLGVRGGGQAPGLPSPIENNYGSTGKAAVYVLIGAGPAEGIAALHTGNSQRGS